MEEFNEFSERLGLNSLIHSYIVKYWSRRWKQSGVLQQLLSNCLPNPKSHGELSGARSLLLEKYLLSKKNMVLLEIV